MPAVIKSNDLPRLRSTRDGRDRIDLVTEELFGWTDIKANFIRYKPGDTAAAHYHVGARPHLVRRGGLGDLPPWRRDA